mgnify:CR=1 FL=1
MLIAANNDEELIGQINTTPLVDVMLVLLIIFLITIPAVTSSVKVDLPKEKIALKETKPDNVVISVDASGNIFMFDSPMNDTRQLIDELKKVALKVPQPKVEIRGDAQSKFKPMGEVMFALERAGIAKVGFITEPGN